MIDLKQIKTDIISLVNAQLNRDYSNNTGMWEDCKTVSFSFLPFQTSINAIEVYVKTPPSTAQLTISSELETYSSGTVSLVSGVNTFSLNKTCVSSIPITVSISSDESWSIIKSDKPKNVYDSCIIDDEPQDFMVAFRITPSKNIIIPVYPYTMLEKDYMPLMTVDVTSRIVRQRYIDINRLEENIRLSFLVLSSTHFELDALTSALEDILCRNRVSIPNIFVITPENVSGINIVGNDILSRQVGYRAVLFAKNRF